RLVRDDVLSHPMRRSVYDRVVATPGTTAGAISRELGVDRRTANHHLRVLREFHAIEARAIGARTRFFKNGGTFGDSEKLRIVALSSDKARTIAAALARNPEASLNRLALETGLPKSTARWHAKRLRRFGLATSE
ncbi:MAG TPA: helix-turn-helix domain-containing protein, partial [Burkholderiales bacterium]|nr:helix-turn-helix domain-containing protein [Burkholderiales bacterium]